MERDEHSDIMLLLGRLDGKLDGLIERQIQANGRTSKLEDRVDNLESTRDQQKGGLKVSGVVAGAVSTAMYFILGKIT